MTDDKKHGKPEEKAKKPESAGQSQYQHEIEGKKQAKEAEKSSVFGETPKPGSIDPGKTVMANPSPQNVQMDPVEPTEDPMATPPAAPLPNPPSQAGGDLAGEPNVSPTGEKLDPSHPDYRKGYEGQHAPDHRSAEEKKAFPRDDDKRK